MGEATRGGFVKLDFTIEELSEPWDKFPDVKFIAHLNIRNIVCGGETEHEAVVGLMRYVAQLAADGSILPEEYETEADP